MGRQTAITDAMARQHFPNLNERHDKQLMLLMGNWTAGLVEEAITYNVKNGLDAWRKLYHNQLPEIENQKQLSMNEFHSLVKATTVPELKLRMSSIERLTSLWTEKADQTFDEHSKVSKLRMVIPNSVYQFTAVEANKTKAYDELAQLVETQIMDPGTGLARWEKNPVLNAVDQ